MSGYVGAPPTGLSALNVAGVPTMGMGGLLPFTGRYFFVNATTGSDGNAGTADAPLATLYRAQQLATASQNDVVFLTGSVTLSATNDYVNSAGPLVWAKDQVHLIGLCDGIKRGKRARIVVGGSAFGPLVSVTAAGCLFSNFATFFGFAVTGSTSPICWQDTGGRNMYDTVEFMGFGDATASTGTAVQTGARAFKLNTSVGEVTWRNCAFGTDSFSRNATNYTLEIAGAAPRCTIDNCDFEAALGASGGSSSHLLIGASGIDKYLNIRRSAFMNATGSGATAMTQCMNISGSAGGMIVLGEETYGFGFTKWETSASARLLATHATVATALPGLAVAPVP